MVKNSLVAQLYVSLNYSVSYTDLHKIVRLCKKIQAIESRVPALFNRSKCAPGLPFSYAYKREPTTVVNSAILSISIDLLRNDAQQSHRLIKSLEKTCYFATLRRDTVLARLN